jgi:hypothetical protein
MKLSTKVLPSFLVLLAGGLFLTWFFVGNCKSKQHLAYSQSSASYGPTPPTHAVAGTSQQKSLRSATQQVSPLSGQESWDKQFKTSHDYFQFVAQAAQAAYRGDGRAAYYVSRALQQCSLMKASYGNAPDPETALNAALAASPSWVSDAQRNTFRLCQGFFHGDAFKDLPARPDGYAKSTFWMDIAYQDADPIAQSFHAGSTISLGNYDSPTEANRAAFDAAQQDINSAVVSGDPATLFEIGSILSNGHAKDPLQGYALSIAACDLGYDCSAESNPQFFGVCASAGTCSPATTLNDVITNSVGSAGYAEAYARAQQIENAISRQDNAALVGFVQLKRPF